MTSNGQSILERLRWAAGNSVQTANGSDIFQAAADEIQWSAGRRAELEAEVARLRAALKRIEAWDKFPASGHLFENGHPMSYGAAFGSNGERDYMRSIAKKALQAETGVKP